MITIEKASEELEFNKAVLHSNPRLILKESFKCGVKFAQRWISVDDEDAPPAQLVLLKQYEEDIMLGYYLFQKERGYGYYSYPEPDIEFEIYNVTYWRPIELS